MEPKWPYLVQRIETRKVLAESAKGVDRYFAFDYMGSAEFEFGALPKAMREMRSNPDYMSWGAELQEIKLEKNGKVHKVYYVGPDSLLETAREYFVDQMKVRPEHQTKEQSYIYETMTGLDRWSGLKKEYGTDYAGWLCIDEHTVFALFPSRLYAQQWLAGLKDRL